MKPIKAYWLVYLVGGMISACGSQASQTLHVKTVSLVTGHSLDSTRLFVYRSHSSSAKVLIDSVIPEDTNWVALDLKREQGYTYELHAQRKHYRGSVSKDGSRMLHTQILQPDEQDTVVLGLTPILPPTIRVVEEAQQNLSANQVIATLKSNSWEGQYLPRLQWEDIPTLLDACEDTTLVTQFPTKTDNPYTVKSARIGLVILWMVEAIRADNRQQNDRPGFLIPVSNVPVLGTRRGNPAMYNRPQTVAIAAEAYRRWWHTNLDQPVYKTAWKNPLKGTGYGWM